MSNNIIKESIFLIIFLLVVVLIIGFIFYEFIPSQVVPEATRYEQASDTTKILAQINEEKQAEEEQQTDEVLTSYQISSEDLTYSNDTQYVKGKNHPFFDYTSIPAEGESDGNVTDSNTITDSNTNTNTNTSTVPSDLATNTTSKNNTSKNTTNTSTNKVDTSTLRDTADSNKSSK